MVAADVEPQEIEPLTEVHDLVLSSLKTRPLGASHSASRALTCSACSWLWQSTTRSSAYLTRIGEPGIALTGIDAGGMVPDPGGLLQPVQCDVQEQGLITPP